MNNNKSKGLAIMFSFLPGAGHLYMGFYKRGLSFMLTFFGIPFIISTFGFNMLGFFIPVLWFYAFFDGINKATSMPHENIDEQDKSIYDNLLKYNKFPSPKWGIWVGIGLIVLGAYLLADRFILEELSRLGLIDLAIVNKYIGTIIFSGVLVFVGVRLVKGSNAPRKDDVQ